MKTLLTYPLCLVLLAVSAGAQVKDSLSRQKYFPEDSSKIKVQRLDINTRQSDFSPQILDDQLVFISGRPNELAVTHTNELNVEVTDLFWARRKDSLRFGNARPFSKTINSPYSEGPFSFNKAGTTLYFSGNGRGGHSKKIPDHLQIYVSDKTGSNWTTPRLADFCSADHSSFHPALSRDGLTLIFCSDMPGGQGGTDLYRVTYENGQWGKPINMGAIINSASNELFPYISEDNMLYFSSKRAAGAGGLDIYRVDLAKASTGKVVMLEFPINGPADDFGICMDSIGASGYFSSNRALKTGDDIYYFYSYPDFRDANTPPSKNQFCYTFFEDKNLSPSDSTITSYEWDFGAGGKKTGEKVKHCFDKPGDYTVQLNIVEKNSGDVFYNTITYSLTVEAPPGIYFDVPEQYTAGTELFIQADKSFLKGYQLNGFYWSFGDGKYNQGKQVKHTFRKTGTYKIVLGITATNLQTQKTEKFKVEKNITIKSTL